MSRWSQFMAAAGLALAGLTARGHGAEVFLLPTPNRAIYTLGAMERYFAPTPGRSWESGTFGCVRSEGWRFHEGIDILPVERDKRGEPADAILATADGTVAYINEQAHLSNYGKYLVLRHQVEGIEIYSLYAHLSQIKSGLKTGQRVAAGSVLGVMGRTTNTREPITKDRAHLHFELALLLNERFPAWFKKNQPGERNDHGVWNGQNLAGLDPRLILLQQRRAGEPFNLTSFIRRQPEMCRVWVRQTDFPWLRRYPALLRRNPAAEREGTAGYEIALNFNGVPIELTPRTPAETRHLGRIQLLSVDPVEYQRNPCRRLVESKNGQWQLGRNGLSLLDLLLF